LEFAFILCSRTDSKRVPKKILSLINGISIIEHLVKKLNKIDIPLIIAIPESQYSEYEFLLKYKNTYIHKSNEHKDPLARMNEAAKLFNVQNIIRITHDKILIEERNVLDAIYLYRKQFKEAKKNYLYSTKFIDGTQFEIFCLNSLNEAARKYKNVEFLTYAIRSVCTNEMLFNPRHPMGSFRFLIDFAEDIKFFEVLFSKLGNDFSLLDAVKYLNDNPQIKNINAAPKLTIYTCAYNSERYLEKCMNSVEKLKDFQNYEYILIDDCSTDSTCELMSKFCIRNKNSKWIRNQKNLGLASSSNIALENARGKFIIRLDSDDYFTSLNDINNMISILEDNGNEALYPDNYYGDFNVIQRGDQEHHVGGALFDKRAINYIKFMDGLRHYEGLEFFKKAKDQLKISYYKHPVFFYTQRDNSLSKTDVKKRKQIKKSIEENEMDIYSVDDFFKDEL